MTDAAPAIITCPHCRTRILPTLGRCPACARDLAAPVVPPAPPRPVLPRYRWSTAGCILLVSGGALAYPLGFTPTVPSLMLALCVMWIGTLGILGIAVRRWQLERRARSERR